MRAARISMQQVRDAKVSSEGSEVVPVILVLVAFQADYGNCRKTAMPEPKPLQPYVVGFAV